MKIARRVRLDFAASVDRSPRAGLVLCALGVASAIAVAVSFQINLEERNGLDEALGRLTHPATKLSAAQARSVEDSAAIERELSVPWSQLLAELESAAHDTSATVAVLEVEPDPAKHQVRITAEARSLPAALAYLERLQKSRVLRYPMLESHERKKDDPEHPVRVKLAAEWRL